MSPTVFESRPLAFGLAAEVVTRLEEAHLEEPFSALDPRRTVRRVEAVLVNVGVASTVFRGGLDLIGAEVDHVWVAIDGQVVDASFPLFSEDFVDALRRFVAGDATAELLASAAAATSLSDRVLGLFPAPLRYLGQPVWSARGR